MAEKNHLNGKIAELLEKLRAEGKVIEYSEEEMAERSESMHRRMEEFDREFAYKEAKSNEEAWSLILNY